MHYDPFMDAASDADTARPPVVWHVAGLDTAGGAGLSADQRASDAMGVHGCPVAAALTAQNSRTVTQVTPVDAAILEAQLAALADDLAPAAIKTGLLGSAAAIEAVCRWVDHFRGQAGKDEATGRDLHCRLALVVDPVLKASSGGAAFADVAVRQALLAQLLPRATVVTPNRAEAHALVHGEPPAGPVSRDQVPALARALQTLGAQSVVITGGDSADGTQSLDWLQTPQASGWLSAPRVPTLHHHGTGCTFAAGVAGALALGHVTPDAVVLARMLTHHALMHAHAAGTGPGPVMAQRGFAQGPRNGGAPLPWLGLGEALPWQLTLGDAADGASLFLPFTPPADRLYGIVADGPQARAVLNAGLGCVQLRHKPAEGLDGHLRLALETAADMGAQLFINDHWRAALAAERPAHAADGHRLGLHLGQEDLLGLDEPAIAALLGQRRRVMLGLSSHSLWELARAAGCGASYIACGPLQPTTTKDMPWRPQGADNLRWWAAHSPVPVVGIGGLLSPDDLRRYRDCGAAALCVVRGLGPASPALAGRLAALREALHGHAHERPCPARPHPVL